MPSSRTRRLRLVLGVLAWLALAAIALATLVPLDLRPESGLPVGIERAGAFGVMALLFALGYPRRLPLLIALMLGVAAGLELLQMIAVHRHARLDDAELKLAGALAGLSAGWLVNQLWRAWRARGGQPPSAGGSSSSHRS